MGWILVDQGVRFPGAQYSAIAQSVDAHDPMVNAGNMTVLLLAVFLLEMVGGAAIFGAATGSGRAPGEFVSPSRMACAVELYSSEASSDK